MAPHVTVTGKSIVNLSNVDALGEHRPARHLLSRGSTLGDFLLKPTRNSVKLTIPSRELRVTNLVDASLSRSDRRRRAVGA